MQHEIEFTGIVTRIKYFRGQQECIVTDGKTEYTVQTRDGVPGRVVRVTGTIIDPTKFLVAPKQVQILEKEDAEKAIEKIENEVLDGIAITKVEPLCNDEIVKQLQEKMKLLAKKLLAASKLGRFLFLKFHNDADGISGAFALGEMLKFKAYQQNSAIYSARDAIRDLGTLHNENKPIVILLDFGSNRKSIEGIKFLKAAGVETVIIDHHPLDNEVAEMADFVLSPWIITHDEDVSKYVAGYLTVEMMRLCGAHVEEYAAIACAGDKSEIIQVTDEDKKKALVLDYLAAHSSFGNDFDFYKKVMGNKELFDSMAQQADETIEEAAQKAMKIMKNTETGDVEVVTFSLDNIAIKGEWPSASKITTRIYEMLSKNNALVCIGVTDKTLIIRMNSKAVEKGLSANDIAEHITQNMSGFVYGGGGHAKAGAIRVGDGFVKDVLGEVLRYINTKI